MDKKAADEKRKKEEEDEKVRQAAEEKRQLEEQARQKAEADRVAKDNEEKRVAEEKRKKEQVDKEAQEKVDREAAALKAQQEVDRKAAEEAAKTEAAAKAKASAEAKKAADDKKAKEEADAKAKAEAASKKEADEAAAREAEEAAKEKQRLEDERIQKLREEEERAQQEAAKAKELAEAQAAVGAEAVVQPPKSESKPSTAEDRFSQQNWQTWTYEECTLLLKRDRQNLYPILRLAQILCNEQGNPEEAQKRLNEVHKNSKSFELPKVFELRGDIALAVDEHKGLDEALSCYLKAQQYDPDNTALLLKIGKCYDKRRDYAKSSETYATALKVEPDNYNIQFKRGWSLFRDGKVDDGLQAMRDGIANGASTAQNLTKLGEILMREGQEQDLAEAGKYLTQSLELEPQSVDTLVCLGRVYEKQGKLDQARERYQQAVDVPECVNVNAYFYLGVICEKQKDYRKAIQLLKQCLIFDKMHFGSCIHLATLLANAGESQKAAKYFKHARAIDKHSIPANFGYGKTLHSLTTNVDAPIPYYQYCIDRDPNHYKAYCQLGIIYLEKMELEKSADCLKKCLSINPNYVLGLVSMGNLLFESGHYSHSTKYHQQALKFSPNEIQALVGMGNALYD